MKNLKLLIERQEKGLYPICCREIKNQPTAIEKYKGTEFIVCEKHLH